MFTNNSSVKFGLTLLAGLLTTAVVHASPSVPKPLSPLSNIARVGYFHTNVLVARNISSGIQSLAIPGPENPYSLRKVYHIHKEDIGSEAIAIVDAFDDPVALHDFNHYAQVGKFPVETSTDATAPSNKVFQVVYASGTKPGLDPYGPLGWDLEESLDFEIAHGTAPAAKIYLVEADSNSTKDLIKAVDVAKTLPGVHEVSLSWGGYEDPSDKVSDKHFKEDGVVFFAASGDSGAPGLYPATSPNVVAVGGTTILRNAGVFVGESGWAGSGGGPSIFEVKPKFQSAITISQTRAIPDISADADYYSGVGVYDTNEPIYGTWFQVGGTSLATPFIAALANDAGKFRLGSQTENKTIYKELGTSKLRDITTGNNGYAASTGYDFVTGVGVPNGLGAL